jgi:hypothetical protein
MRICLVLGAGASLANAEHFHRERRQDENPPLDTTFFAKIRARNVPVPLELRDYAAALPTGSPFDPVASPQRMEEFFKDLFYDFLQETRTDTKTVRAYTQLVSIYTRVLRETTDWMGDDKRVGGPVGRLIDRAADAADGVTIVTFNHDLVIENEIHKRARLRKRWCLERGYGTFAGTCEFTKTRAQPQFPPHGNECRHDRPLTVLKLHGSLNWYLRIRGERPSPRVLTGQSGSREVRVTRRRFVPAQLHWNLPQSGKGRKRWYTWPVIVPPIYAKQALIRAFMPDVWNDAASALRDSDRVLFFGYSMPQLDVEAEKLFQRGLASNSILPWVEVINPSPVAAERFARLFPFKPLRWFPSVSAFEKDGFS